MCFISIYHIYLCFPLLKFFYTIPEVIIKKFHISKTKFTKIHIKIVLRSIQHLCNTLYKLNYIQANTSKHGSCYACTVEFLSPEQPRLQMVCHSIFLLPSYHCWLVVSDNRTMEGWTEHNTCSI